MSQATALKKDAFGIASNGKLAMWLFIIMDGLSFGGILIGGVALRADTPMAFWPDPGTILNIPLTAFNTFLLICSSFTMVMALDAIRKDDQKGLKKFLILTILGGLIFLGIQVYGYMHFITGNTHLAQSMAEYGMKGSSFLPSSSIYSAIFYGTTAFHGIHVLSGIIYMICILIRANKGHFSSKNYDAVEILGLFWHFIDLAWILVFTVIYLI
ncbi:hypothetical protein MNBD_UNCLBAC01-1783 [hydrothermal vent metagenome]|uniref:Heme-copper oxidase subunit III family profile domain-containing protein n=1 Tax=hydrothermal vent metagenome TaxID=652676 RepID=A0A3B1CYX4_9ZZZZ